ncbi:unnamed protein product, partial [marine sediment metagenome]
MENKDDESVKKEICIIAKDQKSKPPYNIIGQCEISHSEWDA